MCKEEHICDPVELLFQQKAQGHGSEGGISWEKRQQKYTSSWAPTPDEWSPGICVYEGPKFSLGDY